MRKTYKTPQLTLVAFGGRAMLLSASNMPQERDGSLHWHTPNDTFDADDEIA